MSSYPRDFQKTRALEAEWALSFGHNSKYIGRTKGGKRIYIPADPTKVLSLEQCYEFADLVIQSSLYRAWRSIDEVKIKNGEVFAYGNYKKQRITLPMWARTKFVIIHELCHLAVWYGDYPAHGREFCGLLLDLVREFLGSASANEMEESYIKHGVQYDH